MANAESCCRQVLTTFLLLTICLTEVPGLNANGGQNSSNWFKMKPFQPQGYVCYRASHPLNIDGKLDDPAWKNAPWTSPFQDIEGSAKPKPRFQTRAKMLWDDNYFYIGADLEEPHISGSITQRDAVIFHDNDFEVFIDPNGDTHEYYEIEINALNTVWDLFLQSAYKDNGHALDDWNIVGLRSAVHLRGTINQPNDVDQGWSVEIAFPWKALGEFAHRPAPPGNGDQWRVDFSRVEWKFDIINGRYQKVRGSKEDNWIWSPPGIIDMHRPERWGYVQFSTKSRATEIFIRDPDEPVRDALMEVYYLQRDYFAKNKRWCRSLVELGVTTAQIDLFTLKLFGNDDSFEVSAESPHPGPLPKGEGESHSAHSSIREATGARATGKAAAHRWHIRQDSKLWSE